jgi:predicted nucleotidyltransferase
MPTKKAAPTKPKQIKETRSKYKVRVSRAATPRRNLIASKCKKMLAQYYGDRLKGVILYGSTARKQDTLTSDLDLLVLLAPPVDYFTELRQLVDILYPIQLASNRLISAKPVAVSDYEAGKISLYRNAKREGILV